jgi:small subunit ribosomal protein S9
LADAIAQTTGRRKRAIARVRVFPGSGSVTVNGVDVREYFKRDVLVMELSTPLVETQTQDRFDVVARCHGGGLSGQAGALKLGIARALAAADPDIRVNLRRNGFLTRDPRSKERKKYGQPGARKRFQFSKR